MQDAVVVNKAALDITRRLQWNTDILLVTTKGYDHKTPIHALPSMERNVQDAIVVNKAALDRGFGRCIVNHTYKSQLRRYINRTADRIVRPAAATASGRFRVLGTDGLAEVGRQISPGALCRVAFAVLRPPGARVRFAGALDQPRWDVAVSRPPSDRHGQRPLPRAWRRRHRGGRPPDQPRCALPRLICRVQTARSAPVRFAATLDQPWWDSAPAL